MRTTRATVIRLLALGVNVVPQFGDLVRAKQTTNQDKSEKKYTAAWVLVLFYTTSPALLASFK